MSSWSSASLTPAGEDHGEADGLSGERYREDRPNGGHGRGVSFDITAWTDSSIAAGRS